jgi:hypothetical protein
MDVSKTSMLLGMVAQSCCASIQEAEAGGSQVWGQLGIHGKTCLKKQQKLSMLR